MDAKTVQKPSPKALSPPLIPPLGDDWLATDCLSLKLTIRNPKKLQGGVGEGSFLGGQEGGLHSEG